ncbi:MAG: hypothetical protein KDA53_05875 [Hyphomonas sp.]|nr:hypothetical protein [Hyphomonas sp.]
MVTLEFQNPDAGDGSAPADPDHVAGGFTTRWVWSADEIAAADKAIAHASDELGRYGLGHFIGRVESAPVRVGFFRWLTQAPGKGFTFYHH